MNKLVYHLELVRIIKLLSDFLSWFLYLRQRVVLISFTVLVNLWYFSHQFNSIVFSYFNMLKYVKNIIVCIYFWLVFWPTLNIWILLLMLFYLILLLLSYCILLGITHQIATACAFRQGLLRELSCLRRKSAWRTFCFSKQSYCPWSSTVPSSHCHGS